MKLKGEVWNVQGLFYDQVKYIGGLVDMIQNINSKFDRDSDKKEIFGRTVNLVEDVRGIFAYICMVYDHLIRKFS